MKRILIGLFVLAAAGIALADDAPVHVGDVAPGFSLPYATRDSIFREPLTLASLVGKSNIVLAFYPADWSGGCTREVCMMRDNFAALGSVNADVVGLSGDYEFSHHEWAKALNLPFRLAADHDHAIAKKYGSFNEASGHDRRTVFVVDKQGKVAYLDMAYSPRDSVSFGKLQMALKGLK
ncbi:MAG: redoxin domain-containing protein [Candidatus Eisenbacteria bacterium]|nr:redoxin domain-containing protein [Candidatus Eisenbacteria bacterium]